MQIPLTEKLLTCSLGYDRKMSTEFVGVKGYGTELENLIGYFFTTWWDLSLITNHLTTEAVFLLTLQGSRWFGIDLDLRRNLAVGCPKSTGSHYVSMIPGCLWRKFPLPASIWREEDSLTRFMTLQTFLVSIKLNYYRLLFGSRVESGWKSLGP